MAGFDAQGDVLACKRGSHSSGPAMIVSRVWALLLPVHPLQPAGLTSSSRRPSARR